MTNICKMMRGFQIWPQNSNGIRFDHFLAKKLQNGINRVFCQHPTVFWVKKLFKSYPIWILRPDLESFHPFAYRYPLDMTFAFWLFDLQCIFENLNLNSRSLKVLEIEFFRASLSSACLKPWETTRPAFNFQSWCFLNNPNAYFHWGKPNKISIFSVLPQSDIFTTPCDLFLNGETIFHQRPAHFEVHI